MVPWIFVHNPLEHWLADRAVEKRPRYVESLCALVADIRGEKMPDPSLDHEFTVQETVLRATGLHQA